VSYAGYTDVLDNVTDLRGGMLEDIRRWDEDAFARSWVTLAAWNADNTWLPHPSTRVDVDLALATLEAVGEKRLSSISGRVFAEPFAYYRGWPDLMLLDRDGGLRFVEVKTTGRLSFGQIVTMSDMREAASLDMRVLRVRRDS